MADSRSRPARRRKLVWLPLVVILAVWALLYLPHLRTSPRWYGDETLTLAIGKALASGAPADRALKITFWHPSYSYQPGYAAVIGAMSLLTAGDILGARIVNILLALAIAAILYLGGRRALGHLPAFFAALLFLTYGQSVIHFRWVYPHNAVALGFLICVLALLRKSAAKPDWTAGLGLGLAAMSHPLFVHGAIAAWLCRLKRPMAWVRMAVIPALVIAGSFGFALWRYWPKNWLFSDLADLLAFYRQEQVNGAGWQALQNIRIFFTHDFFHVGALVGMLLCLTRRRLYPIALFGLVVAGLLLKNRQNLPLFYYQAVILLPVFALGWAGGWYVLARWIRERTASARMTRLAMAAALVLPVIFFVQILPASLSGRLVSRNDVWVTQNTNEVDQAAQWINARVSPQDLVICGPNIGWLLHCHVADYIQATTWAGHPTFTFDQPLDHAKFLHPADVEQARFLVIGDIEQRWTFYQPNVSLIADRLQKEQWPLVWKGPNYIIVENPRFIPPHAN